MEHLTISDENFAVALRILTKEFLNMDCNNKWSFWVNLLFRAPLWWFHSVKHFLTKVKANFLELKRSSELDF